MRAARQQACPGSIGHCRATRSAPWGYGQGFPNELSLFPSCDMGVWRWAVGLLQLVPVAGAAGSCAWTDPVSGATFDLTPIQAEQHYQFRGLVGGRDGQHATTITAYEDYTYFLNLCKPATALNFHKCDGKPVSNGAVYQVHRSKDNPECFVLGSSDSVTWGLSVPNDPSQGVTLTYGDGEICNKRIERQVEKLSEPPPPPQPECNPTAADPAAEVTTACAAHVSDGGGGQAACNADPACTFKPAAPPEPPSTYTETVTEWEESPRKVTVNMTCDPAQGESISSLVKMAGSVIAIEPQMCEYVIQWPTRAGCPGEVLTGRASLEAGSGGTNSVDGESSAVWRWSLRLLMFVLAVLMYRDGWRKPIITVLPLPLKRWLRSGGDGSLLPSPRKSH